MGVVSIAVLLAASVVVTAFAQRKGLSAPLLIVMVALAASYLPGIPEFEIEPEIILSLVLPPLLYSSALDVSVVSFRRAGKAIWRLGIVLVLVTALVAGATAFFLVPDMTWPVALLIGAIVAPPDAVSATAIGRKAGLPRHVMTILTGESLVNDATSLTLMKVALAIIGGASLSLQDGAGIFAAAVLIGVGLGGAVGWIYQYARRLVDNPPVEILLGLLLPFFVYVGAEHLGGSGVLAVVTAGVIVGYNAPKLGYRARLAEAPVWAALNLLLEGAVFALIGLQLHAVVVDLVEGERGLWRSIGVALAVLAVCIVVRFAFVFLTSWQGNRSARRHRAEAVRASEGADRGYASRLPWSDAVDVPERPGEVELTWQQMFVVSWAGMRGVVTLAGAVAVPAIAANGDAVPAHGMIMLIAFVVTIGTLLLQGLTLPALVRRLDVADHALPQRDAEAKAAFLRSSLEEALSGIIADAQKDPDAYRGFPLQRYLVGIRDHLEHSERRFVSPVADLLGLAPPGLLDASVRETTVGSVPGERGSGEGPGEGSGEVSEMVPQTVHEYGVLGLALRREILRRRREILVRERDAGHLEEDVMREIQQGFDADEFSMEESPFAPRQA